MRTRKPPKVLHDRRTPGVRQGTMTLCQVCGFAIVFTRDRFRSAYGRGRPYVEMEIWKHVGPYGAAGHDVELPRFIA